MKERPILFSGPMVRAILEGRKTQTRRVVKGRWLPLVEAVMRVNGRWVWTTMDYDLTTPYGEPGDRLWVRETWAAFDLDWSWPGRPRDLSGGPWPNIVYRADDGLDEHGWKRWRPSIHMPRWACRITLEVTDVRVERLKDITEDDAMAEGWIKRPDLSKDPEVHADACRDWFVDLWDSINAKRGYGWETNPWVWRIEFQVKEVKEKGDICQTI